MYTIIFHPRDFLGGVTFKCQSPQGALPGPSDGYLQGDAGSSQPATSPLCGRVLGSWALLLGSAALWGPWDSLGSFAICLLP